MAQLPTRYLVRCFCSSSLTLEKQKMVEKWCDAFLQDVEPFTDKTTIHQNLFHIDWNALVNSPLWLIKHERNMPKKNGFNITELFSTPKKHIESNIIKPFFSGVPSSESSRAGDGSRCCRLAWLGRRCAVRRTAALEIPPKLGEAEIWWIPKSTREFQYEVTV